MSRHPLDDAERGFLSALLDDGEVKTAVDLSPETAEALGIQTVNPKTLDLIESSVGNTVSDAVPAEVAPSGQPTPAEPAEWQEIVEEDEPPSPGPDQAELENPPNWQELVEEEDNLSFEDLPDPVQMEVEPFDPEDEEPLVPEGEEVAEPELPLRAKAGGVFKNRRAHPLLMLDLLELAFQGDWAEWTSETLYWAIRRNYGPIGELNRNKIMALRIATTSDVPWLDWDVFEDCGLAWNDVIPMIGVFQPMSPAQMAFAVHCLRDVRDDQEFGHEVLTYIAALLDEDGWLYAPEEYFDRAYEVLERNQEHVALRSEVKHAWEKVRNVDPESIVFDPENPVDMHVLKLFAVQRYLDEREQLREDLGKSGSSQKPTPPIPSTPS